MDDQQRPKNAPVESDKGKVATTSGAGDSATDETARATELTPEEQMALFEKELKESDWGHQPC
jgi:hypothetical protein